MRDRIKWMLTVVLAAVILLLLVGFLRDANATARILTQAELADILSRKEQRDKGGMDGTLRILGENAPYDEASERFYVPQSLEKTEWELPLTWSRAGYRAYLCPDAYFDDKKAAIAEGHAFSLLIVDGSQYFYRQVVFTGMPMITLHKQDRVVTESGLYLLRAFDPSGGADGGYLVQRSYTTFRPRGASSLYWDKKSYRLYLQDGVGKPAALALLGLRLDDDWILNAMYTDPQKMRDKLCVDIWNALCASNSKDLPYTHAEFTEVTIEDAYSGLYCLMEPVGKKSTGLDAGTDYLFQIKSWINTVLMPGERCETADLAAIGEFEQIGTDGEQMQTRAKESVCDYVNMFMTGAEALREETVLSRLNLSSLIDFALFNEVTTNADSTEKNAFVLGDLQPDGSYEWTLIPWDCNESFGLTFTGTVEELTDQYMFSTIRRIELDRIETACPALVRSRLNARYAELRATTFSDEAIAARIRALTGHNVSSGALARDAARWPESSSDANVEPLIEFMRARLAYLDAVYAALPQ